MNDYLRAHFSSKTIASPFNSEVIQNRQANSSDFVVVWKGSSEKNIGRVKEKWLVFDKELYRKWKLQYNGPLKKKMKLGNMKAQKLKLCGTLSLKPKLQRSRNKKGTVFMI